MKKEELKSALKLKPAQNGRGKSGYLVDVRVWIPGRATRRCRVFVAGAKPGATVFGNRMILEMGENLVAQLDRHVQGNTGPELLHQALAMPPEVPRLRDYLPRFLEAHVRANKLKPSTADGYEYRSRIYLIPVLGDLRLDEIDRKAVIDLKARISKLSGKTINLVLGVLHKVLDFAVGEQRIAAMPFRLKDVKVKEAKDNPVFYDFDEFNHLVDTAFSMGKYEYAFVLLGGEAGLRRGEIAALDWNHVDLRSGRLTVALTLYKGQFTPPKGNISRTLKMSPRLREALVALPSRPAGDRVLLHHGEPCSEGRLNEIMGAMTKAAGIEKKGARKVHILRHTFCSHLAMLGAQAVQIQHLAGHADLKTTQQYMHLAPGHADEAIDLFADRVAPQKPVAPVVVLPVAPAPAALDAALEQLYEKRGVAAAQ